MKTSSARSNCSKSGYKLRAKQLTGHAKDLSSPDATVARRLTVLCTLFIGILAADRIWMRAKVDFFLVVPSLQDIFIDDQTRSNTSGLSWNESRSNHISSASNTIEMRRHTHVFYNIFVPDDLSNGGRGTERAYRIVTEQLLQTAQSYVGGYYGSDAFSENGTNLPTVTVHYTTIGPTNLLTESEMNDPSKFCGLYPNFRCRHLGHFVNGSEAYTLDQLRKYCVGHQSDRVVYLHSKGSYHHNRLNEGLRKALTFGATTKECVDPPDASCTVCGILFYTQFTTFVPGNMFAAKCDYVAKLLSPMDEFPKKHQEAIGDAMLLRIRRQLTSNLLNDQIDYYGLDRYNAEHWIGT
jgi:hypothetical protein